MISPDKRQIATILAALRCYQTSIAANMDAIHSDFLDIATSGGTLQPLNETEIDALCEAISFAPKEPTFDIPDLAWEATGPAIDGEGSYPESRLLTAITINGTPMHLEAYAVREADAGGQYSGGEQIADDPYFEDEVQKLQDMQDTSFVTTEIEGRTYILVATPNGE